MNWLFNKLQDLLDLFRHLDFLGSLALRLYLAPIFWVAGMAKAGGMSHFFSLEGMKELFTGHAFADFASWLGSMGLPYPEVLAYLAAFSEIFGAIFLLIGFAVRWISIPLMITMLVAIFTVHWDNGWQFVADPGSPFASSNLGPLQLENVSGATERLDKAKEILQQHGNYDWLTEKGHFVIVNNGIELAVTYLVMLLALFFLGAGKFFSVDYWLHRKKRRPYIERKLEKKRLKKMKGSGLEATEQAETARPGAIEQTGPQDPVFDTHPEELDPPTTRL